MRIAAPMQIETTPARLGMESSRASLSIRQPRADLSIEQPRPELSIRQPAGVLRIDQEKAWDALGIGPTLAYLDRIASQMYRLGLEAIGEIAARGDRLGRIHTGENAIPALAERWMEPLGDIQRYGEAAFDNVDISYEARKPVVEAEIRPPRIHAAPRSPEAEYRPWQLEIYMMQYPKVAITPPVIDYTA